MKRDRIAVVHDILQAIHRTKTGVKATTVMRFANVQYYTWKEMLPRLMELEFISTGESIAYDARKKKGKHYFLTRKGIEYMYQIRSVLLVWHELK